MYYITIVCCDYAGIGMISKDTCSQNNILCKMIDDVAA